MADTPDNVVLTRAAALSLRAEFLGWQCRLRQLAAREAGGRPSTGMCPRITTKDGAEVAAAITVLITESEPEVTTHQLRFQYEKTQDPNERFDKAVEFLQGRYFQEPTRFSDVMTALFGPDSIVARRLVEAEQCTLGFAQYGQGYTIPCKVSRLQTTDPRYQATFWHNRLFNQRVVPGAEVLAFTPKWTHSRRLQR